MTNGDSVGEVVIDVFPSSVERYVEDHAIVAIDVIRATTMAVTALALGRRCLIARDLDDAFALKAACHPALVRRALEIAGMELGERVRLHARSTDAIVVAPASAGPEFLKSVADKLDHILSQSLGLSSISLRFDELVELPGGGRGRLREVFRVTRP